jgi:hypothetical protein
MRNIMYQPLSTIQRNSGGGQAAPVDLLRAVKTHAIILDVELDVTIVGAGGGNVVAEGLQSMISLLQLKENGKPTVELTGKALGYLTQRACRAQGANIEALANAGAQANTILQGQFIVDFASIYGADPSETAYVERDARFPTQLVLTFPNAADAEAALIDGTGLTVNSFIVNVTQMFDPNSRVMPFFLPRIRRTTSSAVVGTQTGFKTMLYPEGNNRVQSVILHAITDGLTNANVINGNVTLRGDRVRYIDAVPFTTLLSELRRFFDAPAPSAGYMELLSRFYGKLSECYIASQDDNWRTETDATNPGVTTVLDAYTLELEPIPGYTRDLPTGW